MPTGLYKVIVSVFSLLAIFSFLFGLYVGQRKGCIRARESYILRLIVQRYETGVCPICGANANADCGKMTCSTKTRGDNNC